MKVLLTGAFGNIGTNALIKMLEQGHQVRCFDRKTEVTEEKARGFEERVEVAWGDLRRPDDVAAAVNDRDVVIHLAFALPPMSEQRPQKAREINVGGTRNILSAMKTLNMPSKIIFASSSSVFSISPENPLPRTAHDDVEPTDHYTQHKLECEKLVKESGLDWAVFRFGVVPPIVFSLKPWVFHIRLDTHMQFLHPQDVALALANAVISNEIWGKTLLIGSGPGSQICYRDFIGALLEAMGVGMLPYEAFSTRPYYTVWMDTSESQRLLDYQRHSFEEFAREMPSMVGYRRYWVRLFRPFYRRKMLKESPYYHHKE